MMENVSFILSDFIFDLSLCVILKKCFKLQVSYFYVLFIQIPSVLVSVVYLFFDISFFVFLLLKILSLFLVCLLTTNSYKGQEFFLFFGFSILIFFSYLGFLSFLILFLKSCVFLIFGIKIAKLYNFTLIFGIILYFLINNCVLSKILNLQNLKKFIHKVSFVLMNQHIEITGLCDTGNSLVDEVTKKPVVVLSFEALKKYFKNMTFEDVLNMSLRSIKCVTAGENSIELPLIEIGEIYLESFGKKTKYKTILAVTKQRFFDSKKYDCLLHRDFI